MNTNYTKRSKFIAKIALGFALFTAQYSFSQATFYGFSENSGTYTELTNATIISTATANSAAGSIDTEKFQVVIPFSFPFSGNNHTNLTIHSDGFVSFGASSPNGSTPISNSVTTFDGAIAAVATDLNALYNIDGYTGNISTKLEGTAPNQEFIIQWKNFRPYSISSSVANYFNWNFQIRLKQDGSIKMVYDMKVTGTPTSTTAQVGLRGASINDFSNRYAGGTTTSNWMSTTPGSGNTSVVFCNSTSLPTPGYTFNWTPPAACVAPVSQPTALTFTVDGVIINGNFSASNPVADKYLVIRTPQGSVPNAPSNGTNYTLGENTSLNGRVIYLGQSTTFTDNALSGVIGNTNYTYTIYALSGSCTGGPLFNLNSPLTSNVTSCPGPVNQLTAANVTANSFVIGWTPNNGNAQPYTYTIQIATDTAFANQIAGSPFTATSTATTFLATGLIANTKYYYRIKAESICSGIYSSTSNVTTLCSLATDLNETFTGLTTANAVACWTTSAWTIGSARGATGVNGAETIFKNLFSSAPTGNFTTLTVGPIAANQELSFDYKQSSYSSPYSALTTWGNFNVQISTDSGATWTTIATVDNEAGTGSYIHKTYSLAAYQGNQVSFKINATRTAGDFDLSFDNFKIAQSSLETEDFITAKFVAYPNPTTSVVTIQSDLEIIDITIFNQIGQLISSQKSTQVDLSNISSGIYILHIDFADGQKAVQKIIKK